MTTIQIISDPICPWCYIGKTRFERALAARPEHGLEISWKPFQLNPDMPPEGMDRRAYLERKFGGKDAAVQVYSDIQKAAEDDGLKVALDKITRTPNTINAHRLIHWAGIEGVQNEAVAALFIANFEDGKDISDPALLADIAETVGMDRAATERLLASDAEIAETRAEDEKAREMGVSGVPTFLIDGQYVVTGARDTAFWVDLIDEINQIKDTTE
ncbi:MAG: DsbA family oxidoreductase [Rhodobacteraceae bacterium]|nr:DsbA family oxidoreductase [Paracoccaceae bacterium]